MRTGTAIRAPRGSVALRAAHQKRLAAVVAQAAADQRWLEQQEDDNLAGISIGVSAEAAADRGGLDAGAYTILDDELLLQGLHRRKKLRPRLLVEKKRGRPGLVNASSFPELQPVDQLPAVTDVPVALLDAEFLATATSSGALVSLPLELIEPPPLQAGFDLPVVSPRPGPRVSADCFAA